MANSDISFDSNDVSSIVSGLRNNVSTLSTVSSNLKTNFNMLTELGLFSSQITKLASKLDNIKSAHESIINAISKQANTYENAENIIATAAENYMSYYNGARDGGNYSLGAGGGNVYVDSVNNGDSINNDINPELNEIDLNNLDDKTLTQLVNFMKKQFPNDTLNNLLKDENSNIIEAYLKKFFKSMYNKDLSAEDIKKIKALLLKKLSNNDTNINEVNDNSFIKYKEYLTNIAKSMNIEYNDFINKDEYKDIRKTVLTNLYNGTAMGDTSSLEDNYGIEFKQLVELKAKEKNLSVEEIINDPNLLM
jgi:hypothetical protein